MVTEFLRRQRTPRRRSTWLENGAYEGSSLSTWLISLLNALADVHAEQSLLMAYCVNLPYVETALLDSLQGHGEDASLYSWIGMAASDIDSYGKLASVQPGLRTRRISGLSCRKNTLA